MGNEIPIHFTKWENEFILSFTEVDNWFTQNILSKSLEIHSGGFHELTSVSLWFLLGVLGKLP